MEDLTSTAAKKNIDKMLEWVAAMRYKAYLDVAYSFKDSAEEDSEGRKEKLGMSSS